MSNAITRIDVYRLNIPLTEPFIISLETITHAENILVRIQTEDGTTGFGECSPYRRIAGETQDSGMAVAPLLAKTLLGLNPLEMNHCIEAMDLAIAGNRCVKSAFDLALHDLAARLLHIPLYQYLGGRPGKELVTDMTVSLGAPEKMAEDAVRFKNQGFKTIKLKLGTGFPIDVARVRAVRGAVGDAITLRVDANQGWDLATAVKVLRGLEPLGVEFCEQPIPHWQSHDLPQLRRMCPIPIMADESLFDHHDAMQLIRMEACDFFNIKLSKAGGIAHSVKIAQIAASAGMTCQVGCFSESRIGMSALAHYALAFSNIRYFDLDAPLMLSADPVEGGILYAPGGHVSVPEGIGIGAVMPEAYLERLEGVTYRK